MSEKIVKAKVLSSVKIQGKKYDKGSVISVTAEQAERIPELTTDITGSEREQIAALEKQIADLEKRVEETKKNKNIKDKDVLKK